jgi:hypothetical protein
MNAAEARALLWWKGRDVETAVLGREIMLLERDRDSERSRESATERGDSSAPKSVIRVTSKREREKTSRRGEDLGQHQVALGKVGHGKADSAE